MRRYCTGFASPPVKAIPAPTGVRHLQIMSEAAEDINRTVTALHRAYGPIFAFGFGPLRFVWLIGAEANRFVLEEAAPHLSLGNAYSFLRTVGGDTALISSDEPEHLTRRRLVQPAFHRHKLARLDTSITARLHDLFVSWAGRTVDLYAELKHALLELICEILLGEAVRGTLLTTDVARMMAFANLSMPTQLVKVPLPGTPWTRFLRARNRADRALFAEIKRRKGTGELGDDILGLLLEARDEHGQGLSNREVRDQAVSLVSAGFETTSAALTWAVYALLAQPNLQRELQKTLERHDDPPLLHYTVRETLRLYPPAPVGLRQATTELAFGEYRIPKGHFVAFSIYATHRAEAHYHDPLTFEPLRWETLKPEPYSYLPFGAGSRYCIGAGLATRIITLGVKMLFRDYHLTPAWPEPVREAGNTLHPKGGLRVTVTRRR